MQTHKVVEEAVFKVLRTECLTNVIKQSVNLCISC